MLSRLHVRNFALLDELELEFSAGLNVLTGETGAGKSLLVGALGLILGKRVDYSMLFHPDRKCVVEAQFTHLPASTLEELAKFDEFDLDEDAVIVRREATTNGKSRAFINDTPVSLQTLKMAAAALVDLHGQHENQTLLSPENQLGLLDQFAGITDATRQFGELQAHIRKLISSRDAVIAREKEARMQSDYFRFQMEELQAAKLDAAEAERLEEQLSLLEHSEQVREALEGAAENLYNGETSLYNRLSETLRSLRKVEGFSKGLREQTQRLDDVRETLQDVTYELEKLQGDAAAEPGQLKKTEERVDQYNRLKMKFGVRTVEELIAVRDDFESRIHDFESMEEQILALDKEIQTASAQLATQALDLEAKRRKAIPALEKRVNALLQEVSLEGAAFTVELIRNLDEEGWLVVPSAARGKTERCRVNATGINHVEFNIRTNKGMPPGPLARIASGGEVSRVMLAIKAALAEKASLSVLIFDEIDTGISGETAHRVGKVMQQLGSLYQVISITHLPQIAGKGSRHFLLYKTTGAKTTRSHARLLQGDDRVLELAKMLSGDPPPKSAIENAKEIINSAR